MEELLHPGDFLWGWFIQVVLFSRYLGPVLTMFRKSNSEKSKSKLGSDWSRF